MKYISLSEFKKINKNFWFRELIERNSIFYGQTNTEKKFTAVEKIGKKVTEYADTFRDGGSTKNKKIGKELAKMLREGKIVIRKGQSGFKVNVGIKNVFKRYSRMIDKLENDQIKTETHLTNFFNRLYDYADYKIGIFLN